jgi:hypothetical protein
MTDGGAAIVTNMAVVRSTLRYFVSVFVFFLFGGSILISVCWERAESLKKYHQSGFICSVPENLSIHALCLSTFSFNPNLLKCRYQFNEKLRKIKHSY